MLMMARTLTLGLVAAVGLFGCSEESTTPETGTPPELPPATTMQIDLGLFDEQAATRLTGGSHDHFLAAVFVAAAVTETMVDAFTPPALAFHTAVGTTPVEQADGSWLWSYAWSNSEGREVAIDLEARHDALASAIDWELRVSDNQADPPLEDVVWVTGSSSTVENSGHWIFHDLADGGAARGTTGRAIVRLDWDLEDASHRSLVIALVDETDENVGDTLTYAVDASIHSMIVDDASSGETADVTWDALTGAGSILWPGVNGGERGCWDTRANDLVDVACP
jgi:hypothetical protein